jgi:hypothetical protein
VVVLGLSLTYPRLSAIALFKINQLFAMCAPIVAEFDFSAASPATPKLQIKPFTKPIS